MILDKYIESIKDLNVLIVEDGKDIRDIMSATLGKLFHSATTAIDGLNGLEKFNENKPNIIISDIRMPNMSGNDMIDKMKESDPSIPIIVVSGHGNMIKKTNKADIFLSKPIKFDKLIEAIYTLTKH